MKTILKKSILLIMSLSVVSACTKTNNQIANPSKDATIRKVSLIQNVRKKKIIPANFTIDNEQGLIYNVDSLPYGTKVDSIYLSFTFSSTLGYIINDSLPESYLRNYTSNVYNLTKPIKIKNLASDGKTTKNYTMTVNVHSIETYKHSWTKLTEAITNKVSENQKSFVLGKTFYFLTSLNGSCKVYSSTDGKTWSLSPDASNIPINAQLANILIHNNAGYLIHDNELYQSTDAINWSKASLNLDNNYNCSALLFYFKEQFWAVAKHNTNNEVRIINSKDALTWNFADDRVFDKNFPVSDFASITFKPRLGREKVLVVGGKNIEGKTLNTRWSAENILGKNSLNWVNLDNKTSNFPTRSNSGLAYYGSKLLLIGGSNKYGNVILEQNQLKKSLDEGLTWISTDSTLNVLPDNFTIRRSASTFVHDQSLYIIGGKGTDKTLSDVWKVRVNFYDFDDKEKY